MLIGVSLGPGDPGLLTLKAVETLRRCTKIYVPGELAWELARPYCQPELLNFPMIEEQEKLEEVWAKNADQVADYARSGDVAFACLGDVNTFSTFTHLKRLIEVRHPEVEVQSIPGVGVVPALAARFGVGLDRTFLVSDGSPLETVIRIKAVRPREMARELEGQGYQEFILGSKLCSPEEEIVTGEMPEKSHYFSVLYARRNR